MSIPKDTKGAEPDDVEAHRFRDTSDDVEAHSRARDTSDDVEAHRLRETGDDVEAHTFQRPRPRLDTDDDVDDVEGHRLSR
jgi:hypothetical protein